MQRYTLKHVHAAYRTTITIPGSDLSPFVAAISPTRRMTSPGTVIERPSIFTSLVMSTGIFPFKSCARTRGFEG